MVLRYIYLQYIWLILMLNVDKYTRHGLFLTKSDKLELYQLPMGFCSFSSLVAPPPPLFEMLMAPQPTPPETYAFPDA